MLIDMTVMDLKEILNYMNVMTVQLVHFEISV